MTLVRYLIWLNLAFFVLKALVPVAILSYCEIEKEKRDCTNLGDSSISTLLLLDLIYNANLIFYILFCSIRLLYSSWKYSRLEARQHIGTFLINMFGMIGGVLLMLLAQIVFYIDPDFYLGWRIGYYCEWLAQILPAMIYLLTERDEDCFNCFNRLVP